MTSLDQLAHEATRLECALSEDDLAKVADLALRIMQAKARASGALLTTMQGRSYTERGDVEREGMRSAVKQVLYALVLLEFIAMPQ